MAISVHCRSRRDLEIRDLGNFFCVFLGNSTITVVRFNAKYTLNTNHDQQQTEDSSLNVNLCPQHEEGIHSQYKSRTKQCQQQYMININLDLQWQQEYMVNINIDLQWQQEYMVNINRDLHWHSNNTWSISILTYSGSNNTLSISTSTYSGSINTL